MASSCKMIVVDDEPITRSTFTTILSQLGYTVRAAEDGFEALALMREFKPDILLSDLNMPGMSGFELLSVVRRLHPGVHVIATSGAFSGKSIPEGVAADHFYEKSTGLAFLFELIQSATSCSREPSVASREPTPIWTTPAGRLPSNEVYVLISCPECMRAFPQMLGKKTSLICDTVCPSCETCIRYAVVRTDGSISFAGTQHDEVSAGTWAF